MVSKRLIMEYRIFKNFVRDYFSFTRGERNGFIVLLFLIILTLIFRVSYPYFSNSIPSTDKTDIQIQAISKFASEPNNNKGNKSNLYRADSLKAQSAEARKTYPKREEFTIEINKADSIELEKLPGIGKYLARGIVKYRDKLGGYYSKDQLMEVYGMRQENFDKIKTRLTLDTSLIQKISLELATFKEINAHPYISYEQTQAIFRQRNKGFKVTIEFLCHNSGFDSVQIKKLLPYLNLGK